VIYVPDLSYKCYNIIDSNTIRAYKVKPYNPSYNNTITIEYRDYYIKSNYIYKDGTQQFNSYTTLPVCLPDSELTDDFYYRNDFDSILTIFAIMSIFCVLLPIKIFSKLFKRGGL